MTANDHLDRQKKGDAVTAQLALAADEKGEKKSRDTGACLSNEQLAAIAMGTCPPKQKEQALAHFADCKKCYDALVAISFSIAAVEQSTSRSRSALTIRNLTWLGSAFAVAASVVVYFNIREVPREIDQQGFAPSAPVIERSAEKSAAVPELLSDGVPDNAPRQPQALQKRSPPEVRSLAEERESAATQQAATPELQRWLSDIASACIGRSADRKEWLTLRARGGSVVASVSNAERSAQLAKIVNLLPEDGATPTSQQCSQIFTLLAQQSEWE